MVRALPTRGFINTTVSPDVCAEDCVCVMAEALDACNRGRVLFPTNEQICKLYSELQEKARQRFVCLAANRAHRQACADL